jgi:hypothetical protein
MPFEVGAFIPLVTDEAIEVADVLVVLVKHRQFGDGVVKDRLLECGALDFCGVLG